MASSSSSKLLAVGMVFYQVKHPFLSSSNINYMAAHNHCKLKQLPCRRMADSKGHLRSTHSSSNIINSKPSLRLKAVGMVSPLLVLWLFLVTHSTGMLPQCHSPNSSTMHRHMMLRIYRSRHISSNTGQAVMTIAMVPPTQEEVLLVLLLIGEEVEHKWVGELFVRDKKNTLLRKQQRQ